MKKSYINIYLFVSILIFSCAPKKVNIVEDDIVTAEVLRDIRMNIDSMSYIDDDKSLIIDGKIVDSESEEGLWGARITLLPILEKEEVFLAKKEGKYNLNANISNYDSLQISNLGYKLKVIKLSEIIKSFNSKSRK